ncbi:MAG: 2-isopropylmalate synthase [Oscillospiraceae bacterium]|nr:2-isopropylmalate synthase [Oscillospiraceae bacterium]
MLRFSEDTHLLEQHAYRYALQDIPEPNLYRDLFPYQEVPKIPFNHRLVPMDMPAEIFMTDTTFRDGQQSREPYTVEQIVTLFDMMHRLGGPQGLIRQTEFFAYSQRDREAIAKCKEKDYRFPEVTVWIRANEKDFQLVKDLDIKEVGILVSCSDYHIFKKLHMSRQEAMEHYLSVVRQALDAGLRPRCHLEDITRADFYGFVVPFVDALMALGKEAATPIKIRACDTLGLGVPFPGVAMPRSVPGILYGLRHYAEVPSGLLEWHGHNDFGLGVANACTAWLYGAGAVNCSLLGVGERTGNVPLETMAMLYSSFRGTANGMNLDVITEIAQYYEKAIGYHIPPMTPFVGQDFNVTRAGIHADGLLKNEEIYNIFDTGKILHRSAAVAVSNVSGAAGLAFWLNQHYGKEGTAAVSKTDSLVTKLKDWVDQQYADGRVTALSDAEMEQAVTALGDSRFTAV